MGIYLAFFIFGCVGCISHLNRVRNFIKEIGINPRYYPKGYKHTRFWFRRFFGIKEQYIPKYFYYDFFMCFFYAFIGPINTIIYNVAGNSGNEKIGGILILICAMIGGVNTICSILAYLIYKK